MINGQPITGLNSGVVLFVGGSNSGLSYFFWGGAISGTFFMLRFYYPKAYTVFGYTFIPTLSLFVFS